MDITVFEKFKDITGYNILPFFEGFLLFSRNYYPDVVQYYSGNQVDMGRAFSLLDKLLQTAEKIDSIFYLKSFEFSTVDFWWLLDLFTDCQTKLWTINNSSRWLRSAIIDRYSDAVVSERLLKTRETFEGVARSLGLSDPDNSWVDIVTNNMIEEEDYSPVGNQTMFKINLRTSGNFDAQNIVDNLSGKNILGKDIDKNFRIDGDIVTVEFDDAIKQSLDTILGCIKGSIPEHPDYGIASNTYGTTIKALSYPTIFKDILNMFSRDGRWSEVNIIDLYSKNDCIFVKINAKTITNNYLVSNIQL